MQFNIYNTWVDKSREWNFMTTGFLVYIIRTLVHQVQPGDIWQTFWICNSLQIDRIYQWYYKNIFQSLMLIKKDYLYKNYLGWPHPLALANISVKFYRYMEIYGYYINSRLAK